MIGGNTTLVEIGGNREAPREEDKRDPRDRLPYCSATRTPAPAMHDATRNASTWNGRGVRGGIGVRSTYASHAVNTAHSGVSVTHANASTLHVSSQCASFRIATPPTATAPHHTIIERAVRGSSATWRWKNRVTASPNPWRPPHRTNFQLAPCHRPPSSIVSMRLR